MATQPRSSFSGRREFDVVSGGRKSRKKASTTLRTRLLSTALALIALALIFRFLPSNARNAQAHTKQVAVQANPADLQLSSVQMSQAVGGEALYLDGRISNESHARVKEAIAEITFLNLQGQPIARFQQSLAGVPKGGVGAVPGEFSQNPIGPNETRFFRVAVEHVPPDWNHEVPELKIVAAKSN